MYRMNLSGYVGHVTIFRCVHVYQYGSGWDSIQCFAIVVICTRICCTTLGCNCHTADEAGPTFTRRQKTHQRKAGVQIRNEYARYGVLRPCTPLASPAMGHWGTPPRSSEMYIEKFASFYVHNILFSPRLQ